MGVFVRRGGRHARHGSLTGWAGLASLVRAASAHPVLGARGTRPATGRHPYDILPTLTRTMLMSRPRNTRDQIIPIPAVHGVSVPGGIEEQEAEGAAAMQRGDCEIIPAKGVPDEELTALGFVLGPVDEGDPLFRQATLPPGWKRAGTGHSMHTDIVDELGRKRIGIFYKAAWYDRRADLTITTVYGYVSECLYHGTTPVLDDSWATKEAVLAALDSIQEEAKRRAEQWSRYSEDHAREYERNAREELAKAEAVRAELAGGAGGD